MFRGWKRRVREYESGIVVDLEISTHQVPGRGELFLLLLFRFRIVVFFSFSVSPFCPGFPFSPFLWGETGSELYALRFTSGVTALTIWHCS
jgi:hypothetical protein